MILNNFIFVLDPLEQFDIVKPCDFFLNNLSFSIFLIYLILYFFSINVSGLYLLNHKNIIIVKVLYFVKTIVNNSIQLKKKYIFFLLLLIFLYILFCNGIGLIPYSFTVTSSLIVTFFLAAMLFLGINIISIYINGFKYLNLFIPSGVPIILIPLLIPIELLSYFSRVISLSVRLFANMMSGHTLLKILVGFLWVFLVGIVKGFLPITFLFFTFILWLIIIIVLNLEIAIAFLQAYVFVVLISIYMNEGINLH